MSDFVLPKVTVLFPKVVLILQVAGQEHTRAWSCDFHQSSCVDFFGLHVVYYSHKE